MIRNRAVCRHEGLINESSSWHTPCATQGWSPKEVEQQVLTPIEEASIRRTAHAAPQSIMCYQIPGTLTKDGKPMVGARDIDKKHFTIVMKVCSPGQQINS